MKKQTSRYGALVLVFVALATALSGCGPAIPVDAKEMIFDGFDVDGEARIESAVQAELLPQDIEMGATEVWCVNVTFSCWSCDYGEFQTCADSRLVRRIDDEWQVSLVFTEKDQTMWEARGCELIEGKVGG